MTKKKYTHRSDKSVRRSRSKRQKAIRRGKSIKKKRISDKALKRSRKKQKRSKRRGKSLKGGKKSKSVPVRAPSHSDRLLPRSEVQRRRTRASDLARRLRVARSARTHALEDEDERQERYAATARAAALGVRDIAEDFREEPDWAERAFNEMYLNPIATGFSTAGEQAAIAGRQMAGVSAKLLAGEADWQKLGWHGLGRLLQGAASAASHAASVTDKARMAAVVALQAAAAAPQPIQLQQPVEQPPVEQQPVEQQQQPVEQQALRRPPPSTPWAP